MCAKFYSSSAQAVADQKLAEYFTPAQLAAMQTVEQEFPFYCNDYYLNLIDRSKPLDQDPIARQIFPDSAELEDPSASFDPLAEERQMPVPRFIRRFDDRAVLLTTGRCAMHCRFCFRKREWRKNQVLSDISDAELQQAADYLKRTPEIKELLLSGGDILCFPEKRVREIVECFRHISSLEILRVGTRTPAVWPERITDSIAQYFGSVEGLWVATHFNHPREITSESTQACRKLIQNGVPVVNQTVLLKGVNDDPAVLEELFRKLIRIRVKPHYLFHVDPVRGVRHFATGIDCGLQILEAFRPRLSSLAVPTFAIDLPEGGGKVALQPSYETPAGGFWDIRNTKSIAYYGKTAKCSDISCEKAQKKHL